MAKKVYVPPRRNVKIRSSQNTRITSSHQKPYLKDGKPADSRAIHPDETQREAATELDLVYILPDGRINFWIGLTSMPEKPDEPESK